MRFSRSDRQARKAKASDHFAPTKPADQLSSSSDDELFDEDAVSATLHKVLKKKEHSHRGIASKFLIGGLISSNKVKAKIWKDSYVELSSSP